MINLQRKLETESRHVRDVCRVWGILAGLLFTMGPTNAQGTSWLDTAGDKDWQNPINWSDGLPDTSTPAELVFGDFVNLSYGTAQTAGFTYQNDFLLTVSNGADLETGFTLLNSNTASGSTLRITGAGSTMTATGLGIGFSSNSICYFTLENSATATVTANVSVGRPGGAFGELQILSNGIFKTTGLEISDEGVVRFSGGILEALEDNPNIFLLIENDAGDVILDSGGGYISTAGHDVGTDAPFSGSGSLTKLGAGSLTLHSASDFSGGMILFGGELIIGDNHALGTGTLQIGNNTKLSNDELLNTIHTISNAVQIAGNFTAAGTPAGGFDFTGPIDLGSADRIITDDSSAQLWFTGPVSGTGGLTIRSGPNYASGGVLLGGTQANTYSGVTTVENGCSLSLSKSDNVHALTGDLIVDAGAVLSFGANNQLSDSCSVTLNGDMLMSGYTQTIGTLLGSGTIRGRSVGIGNQTLAINGGDFEGDFIEIFGATTLIKSSANTLTLRGTLTHEGQTVVNNGTLLINGSVPHSPAFVQIGAALGGSGTLGNNLTLKTGGTLTPGNSVGALTINGSLIMESSFCQTDIEIEGNDAEEYDRVICLGSVYYAGSLNLDFPTGYEPYTGQTFSLFDVAGGVTGDFDAITTSNPAIAASFDPATGILTITQGLTPPEQVDVVAFSGASDALVVDVQGTNTWEYFVAYSTNLNTSIWVPLTNTVVSINDSTNRFLINPMALPEENIYIRAFQLPPE